MTSFLSVENLSILDEENKPLVRNVSFSIPSESVFFLVGETGSGKTPIAQAIAGTLAKRLSVCGKVFLKKQNLLSVKEKELKKIWGRYLFLMPQEPSTALNPLLSVFRQVREVFQHLRGMDRHTARTATQNLFSALGITQEASRERPGKLSGGMAQRALLAMALASPAEFILLDEPTKGLDSSRKEDATALVKGIINAGKTLLCITHDFSLPKQIGGQTGVLFSGLLVESGDSQIVLQHPSHPYTQGLLNALPERGLHPISDELLAQLERAWCH
jgi:ABC-type glutathione transport system ATPase component